MEPKITPTMDPYQQKYDEAREGFQALAKFNPPAMKGFVEYIHAVEKDGHLSSKFKQILTVAISVVKRCEWCIVYHTKKALEYGATKEELLEACMVTSLMDGGPAMMYAQIVSKAADEFMEPEVVAASLN